MAESGLFIGWGDIRTGRDAAANTVFAEALAYWPTLQAAGEIESFETVILGAHGGDLGGFFLLRGVSRRLRHDPPGQEFLHLGICSSSRLTAAPVLGAPIRLRIAQRC
jgi:hypothetical protein